MLWFKDCSLLHKKVVPLPLCSFGVRSPRDAMAALRRAPPKCGGAPPTKSLMHRPRTFIASTNCRNGLSGPTAGYASAQPTWDHRQEIPSAVHAPFIEQVMTFRCLPSCRASARSFVSAIPRVSDMGSVARRAMPVARAARSPRGGCL